VPDGTQLRVALVANTVGTNKLIADLGMVTAPTKEFNVTLPQPFPVSWIGQDKLKDNTGGGTDVLFEVIRADKISVNSYCGSFCVEPEFSLKCCPTSNTTKCGCDGCSCATSDVCNASFQCGSNGKCSIDLPGAGELCPMGQCERNFNCQCPVNNPSCQPSEKACVDTRTCPMNMPTLPGKLNCPCSNPGLNCEAGLACVQYTCKASSGTPIATQTCSAATDPKNPDACMLHPAGSNAIMPYNCDGSTCKACAPGDRYCICNVGTCKNTVDYCTQAGSAPRCFPRTGCADCPCNPDSSCSGGDTTCVSNTCQRSNTVASTTTVTPQAGTTFVTTTWTPYPTTLIQTAFCPPESRLTADQSALCTSSRPCMFTCSNSTWFANCTMTYTSVWTVQCGDLLELPQRRVAFCPPESNFQPTDDVECVSNKPCVFTCVNATAVTDCALSYMSASMEWKVQCGDPRLFVPATAANSTPSSSVPPSVVDIGIPSSSVPPSVVDITMIGIIAGVVGGVLLSAIAGLVAYVVANKPRAEKQSSSATRAIVDVPLSQSQYTSVAELSKNQRNYDVLMASEV
jgi:hypothetical protein